MKTSGLLSPVGLARTRFEQSCPGLALLTGKPKGAGCRAWLLTQDDKTHVQEREPKMQNSRWDVYTRKQVPASYDFRFYQLSKNIVIERDEQQLVVLCAAVPVQRKISLGRHLFGIDSWFRCYSPGHMKSGKEEKGDQAEEQQQQN